MKIAIEGTQDKLEDLSKQGSLGNKHRIDTGNLIWECRNNMTNNRELIPNNACFDWLIVSYFTS